MKITLNWRALLKTLAYLAAGCIAIAAIVPAVLYTLSGSTDIGFLMQLIAIKAVALGCIALAYLAYASAVDFVSAWARTLR